MLSGAEKALELQKQNQNACLSAGRRQASIVSIIRDLIKKDWQEWAKKERKSECNGYA